MSHRSSWREIIPQTVPNENLRQNPPYSPLHALKALQGDAGDLALKVLERLDPDLAPAAQRLKHEGAVDLIAHPAWLTLRLQILQVLAPYPEARAQLAEMLSHDDSNGTGH